MKDCAHPMYSSSSRHCHQNAEDHLSGKGFTKSESQPSTLPYTPVDTERQRKKISPLPVLFGSCCQTQPSPGCQLHIVLLTIVVYSLHCEAKTCSDEEDKKEGAGESSGNGHQLRRSQEAFVHLHNAQ